MLTDRLVECEEQIKRLWDRCSQLREHNEQLKSKYAVVRALFFTSLSVGVIGCLLSIIAFIIKQ
jgi:hypothetical protein